MRLLRCLKGNQLGSLHQAAFFLLFMGVVFGQPGVLNARAASLDGLTEGAHPAHVAINLRNGGAKSVLPAGEEQAATPGPTDEPFNSVEVSTPGADGSIYHIVQPGENLALIAQAYSISLGDLMALNGLTSDSVIFPNQKLLIRSGSTLTPTIEVSETFTPHPATPTSRPTRTPTIQPTLEHTATPESTNSPEGTDSPPSGLGSDRLGNALLIAVGALVVLGVGFIVTGSLIKRSA